MQALRGVRDRESGMLLNGIRARLDAAVEERHDAIETEELERLYAGSSFDVTLPGEPFRRGRLHLLTQVKREIEDVFLGMGFEVYEGAEVTDAWHNFDALTTDRGHPSRSPSDTFYLSDDVLLRTHTSPDQIRLMESRQPPIYAIMPGRVLPPRHAGRDAFADVPPGREPRGRPRHHARRSQGDGAPFLPRAVRHRARGAHADELLPLHRAVGGVRRDVFSVQRTGLRGVQALRLDRDGRRRLGRSAGVHATSATTPTSGPASPSGSASSASRCSVTASPTCASSGRTTCACWSSSEMKVPVSWLREYVDVRPAGRGARAAARLHELRGRPRRPPRRARRGRQPRALPRRQGARGGEASERRPAAADDASTSGRESRARSSAARGTSAPARRSPWRFRARRCRTA